MNLADILIDSARTHSGRTAVVFYDRRITYEQICDSAMRFASALIELGISPGDRIALALPNVPEFPVAYYGALAMGAEVVQINPLYTTREINYIFKDSRVKLAVTHPMVGEAVAEACRANNAVLLFSDNMGDPAKQDIARVSAGRQPLDKLFAARPRDTAMIVYTNAYLGDPMGACLTHSGLLFDADACRKVSDSTCDDSFLAILPLYHAFSLTTCLNLPFLTGAKTVLNETFSEARSLKDMKEEKITIFPAVPTMMKRILDKHGSEKIDLSFAKGVIPGGAPTVYTSLYPDFSEAFNVRVFEGYGITECGPVTSSNLISQGIHKFGTIGPALENISVKIIDDSGRELPVGEKGELAVRGENVMEHYLNRPEETAKFLVDGWFHTGDFASLDEDGFITIHGLKKRMILVGGFNVYPAEVERELLLHPAVKSCKVYGAPDDLLGEKVVAEVVTHEGCAASRVEIQKFLRKVLAPYKVPRNVEST